MIIIKLNGDTTHNTGIRLKMISGILLPMFIFLSLTNYFLMAYLENLTESTAAYQKLLTVDIVIFIAALLIMLISILCITNSIVRPIKKLIGFSESLAAGKTDFKIDIVRKKDEIGQLARAIRGAQLSLRKVTMILNTASGDILKGNLSVRADTSCFPGDFGRIMDNNNKIDDSICGIIRNIRDAASSVAAAAQEISAGSQDLAQGSTTQSARVDEISNTVSFYLDRTKIHSENAQKAKNLSDKVNSKALNGSRVMEQLMTALEDINKSSSYIAKVIKVIEDISFQTNILALNAAVEAAHAGVHGKGFGVVAEEVKKLAEKSSKAAQETNDFLTDSINKAKYGLDLGVEMESNLSEIVSGISQSLELISEINEDCVKQVDTIEQLNTGLSEVSQVVQNNMSTAVKAAAASEELSAQSEKMLDMVSHYKINIERVVTKPSGWNDADY